MDELKPCPFCGGGAIVDVDLPWYFIICIDCSSQSGIYINTDEAIKKWNTRKGEDNE